MSQPWIVLTATTVTVAGITLFAVVWALRDLHAVRTYRTRRREAGSGFSGLELELVDPGAVTVEYVATHPKGFPTLEQIPAIPENHIRLYIDRLSDRELNWALGARTIAVVVPVLFAYFLDEIFHAIRGMFPLAAPQDGFPYFDVVMPQARGVLALIATVFAVLAPGGFLLVGRARRRRYSRLRRAYSQYLGDKTMTDEPPKAGA